MRSAEIGARRDGDGARRDRIRIITGTARLPASGKVIGQCGAFCMAVVRCSAADRRKLLLTAGTALSFHAALHIACTESHVDLAQFLLAADIGVVHVGNS